MARYKFLILALLAVLSVTACNSDEVGGGHRNTSELMSFTYEGDLPVVAAPDEEVYYTLKVLYSKGLSSVVASLDGAVIEGSEQSYDGAPTEIIYEFAYVVKGAQFGQTLDFVFTATGVDGYKQSVDYPLWVTANEGEFIVGIPDGQPAKIYSDENVAFELSVSGTNVLQSFVVTKDDVQVYSKTDFGATEKQYKHQFEYVPVVEDVEKDVVFHFIATDIKGNIAEAYYTVTVLKADMVAKVLYNEIFDTSLSISGTNAYNTTEGNVTTNVKTEFNTGNIVKYNTLYDNSTGEQVPVPGAMEGCTVYDNDLSNVKYTSDGVDVCLSKYQDSRWTEITGAYLWYRKAKGGWFRVDGIKLHDATSLKLTYTQSTPNGKIKVEYSVDGGSTWSQIIATSAVAKTHEQKFTLPQTAETISLKFTENGGTDHVRIDNIKLTEVL